MARYKKGVDGNYRASIVIGRTASGSQRRKTVKAGTIKDLEAKLAELKMQYDRGMDFDSSKMTVVQWAEQWLEAYKRPAVAESAADNTASILNKHILPAIGQYFVTEIRPHHLQTILNTQKGKSRSNTQKILQVLRGVFARA